MIELINFSRDTSGIQKMLNKIKNTPITKVIQITPDRFHCYNTEDALLGCIKLNDKKEYLVDHGRKVVYGDKMARVLVPGHEDDLVLGYTDKELYEHLMSHVTNTDTEIVCMIKAVNEFYNRRKKQLNQYCDKLTEAKDNRCANCYRANRCYGMYINDTIPGV